MLSVINTIEVYLKRQSPNFIFSSALFLSLFIGCLDYITGSDISIGLFYLFPILMVVWCIGKRAGIIGV